MNVTDSLNNVTPPQPQFSPETQPWAAEIRHGRRYENTFRRPPEGAKVIVISSAD